MGPRAVSVICNSLLWHRPTLTHSVNYVTLALRLSHTSFFSSDLKCENFKIKVDKNKQKAITGLDPLSNPEIRRNPRGVHIRAAHPIWCKRKDLGFYFLSLSVFACVCERRTASQCWSERNGLPLLLPYNTDTNTGSLWIISQFIETLQGLGPGSHYGEYMVRTWCDWFHFFVGTSAA